MKFYLYSSQLIIKNMLNNHAGGKVAIIQYTCSLLHDPGNIFHALQVFVLVYEFYRHAAVLYLCISVDLVRFPFECMTSVVPCRHPR